MARAALILDTDNHDGAYLARLLLARGYRVVGVGAGARLGRLGIAAEVTLAPAFDPALLAAARVDEVYDLRGPGPSRAEDTAELLGALRGERLFSGGGAAADPASERVAVARAAGHFAVTGHLFDRESRLGDGASFVARLISAAFAGAEPDPSDLDRGGDVGWAPEYVDAMWRMLQRSNPADFVVATGRTLGGNEVARHAFAYFGHDASRFGEGAGGAAVGDPGPARTDLGWSATTWGRDLVRTLCEGLAEQRGAWG